MTNLKNNKKLVYWCKNKSYHVIGDSTEVNVALDSLAVND